MTHPFRAKLGIALLTLGAFAAGITTGYAQPTVQCNSAEASRLYVQGRAAQRARLPSEAHCQYLDAARAWEVVGCRDSALFAAYQAHRVPLGIRDMTWDSAYVADTLPRLVAGAGAAGEAVLRQARAEVGFFSFEIEEATEAMAAAYPRLQSDYPAEKLLVENRQMYAFLQLYQSRSDEALRAIMVARGHLLGAPLVDSQALALHYNNTGLVHAHREDERAALEAYERALALTRRLPDASESSLAVLYGNITDLHSSLGRYDLALDKLWEAFELPGLKSLVAYADYCHLYSQLMLRMGLAREALVWATRADSLVAQRHSLQSAARFSTRLAISEAQLALGDLQVAAETLASVDAFIRGPDANAADHAIMAQLSTQIALAAGDVNGAWASALRSIEAVRAAEDSVTVLTASVQTTAAEVALARGDPGSAVDLVREAVNYYIARGQAGRPAALAASATLVEALAQAGQLGAARGALRAVLAEVDALRAGGAVPPEVVDLATPLATLEAKTIGTSLDAEWLRLADGMAGMFATQQTDYVRTFSAERLEHYRHVFRRASLAAAREAQPDANRVLVYADFLRALAARRRAYLAQERHLPRLTEDLTARLERLERGRLALTHSEMSVSQRKSRTAMLDRAEADLAHQIRGIAPDYHAQLIAPLFPDGLSNYARPSAPADGMVVSLSLDPNRERIVRVAYDADWTYVDVQPLSEGFFAGLREFSTAVSDPSVAGLGDVGYAIYAELLGGLPDRVSRAPHITIVADEGIHSLPWAALVSQPPREGEPFGHWSWWGAGRSISTLETLAELRWRDEGRAGPLAIQAFAPGFDPAEAPAFAAVRDGGQRMTRTPWTSRFVRRLGELYGASVTVGSAATESSLAGGGGITESSAINCLHLGTHAIWDAESPMRSYFAMTPVSAVQGDDGRLHAFELYSANLPVALAILPACHSGVGVYDGEAGQLSLAGAMRAAGCPTVIQAHWAIDDEQTNRLLEGLYERLASGESAATALSGAREAFLVDADAERQHPYFWAGLSVVGPEVRFGHRTKVSSIVWLAAGGLIAVLLAMAAWSLRGPRKENSLPS